MLPGFGFSASCSSGHDWRAFLSAWFCFELLTHLQRKSARKTTGRVLFRNLSRWFSQKKLSVESFSGGGGLYTRLENCPKFLESSLGLSKFWIMTIVFKKVDAPQSLQSIWRMGVDTTEQRNSLRMENELFRYLVGKKDELERYLCADSRLACFPYICGLRDVRAMSTKSCTKHVTFYQLFGWKLH